MNVIIKRLFKFLLVIVSVSLITFLMVDRLPGDMTYQIAGPGATPEEIRELQQELGLDRNVMHRYLSWLSRVSQGDLGISAVTGENVADAIISRLPVTLELLLISQMMALALAIPCGIISAYKAHSRIDRVIGSIAFGFMSIPIFILAIVFIYLFALKLEWLPATGYIPLSDGFWGNIQSLLLPSLSIALVEWVSLTRVLRSDMIATLKEDFILLVRAKGISDYRILLNHALKPSSFTLITILGIQIGHLISGAVIVETIFSLPGLGRLLVEAIYGRDVLMIQGCILFVTCAYVTINFMVDFLYSIFDPRIRVGQRI